MNRIILLLLCALLLLPGCGRNNAAFTQEENGVTAEHDHFSGSRDYTVEVPEGKDYTLRVEVTTEGGELSMTVGQEGESPVYTGNGMDSGCFNVNLRDTGTYTIHVDAHRHQGSYCLRWEELR